MPMRLKFIAALTIASVFASNTYARSDEAWRSQISKEEVRFNVSLSSGVIVKNVIYKHPKFNDGFYILLRSPFGLEISNRDGKALNEISHDEFMELMAIIIEKVKIDHDGILAGIHIDLGLVEDLWIHLVEQMRVAPMPSSTLADPKSKALARQFDTIMRESTVFDDICSFASRLGKHCSVDRYQIENVIFTTESYMTPWEDAKYLPDAGMDKKFMWAQVRYK